LLNEQTAVPASFSLMSTEYPPHLPMVGVATLLGLGEIRRDTQTALIRFCHEGVEYGVGVRVRRFRNGGFRAMLMCPRCAGRSQRLRLLDGQPACVRCARASGLIYRSQATRTEKRHVVTAPPRIALLRRNTPMRINSRPNRVAERRANIEFALRRSLIVARKHGVDRAKDQGF
jgi:hypothetical protein